MAGLPHFRGHLSLDWKDFFVVTHGYFLVKPDLDRVCSNHAADISLVMRKLKQYGYQRVGYFNLREKGKQHNYLYPALYSFYQEHFAKAKIPPLLPQTWSEDQFIAWYKKYRPQVVVSPASEVKRWLENMKPDTNEEVGFVSLNTNAQSEITGINQKFEQMGVTAVDLLASLLNTN